MHFRRMIVIGICVLSLGAAAAGPAYIPIAAARTRAHGTTVTVMGSVTVPSGDFRSSSADEGFAIQDQTGGIWVSVKKNPRLALGQTVIVTGTLGVSAGKLQIVPADSSGVTVRAREQLRVATGQVGPATLGYLITIEGTVTSAGIAADLPYGYKVFLDDGSGPAQVYVNASTNIDPNARYFQPGRRLRVTGFASQYDTAYEVEPRSRRDLVPLP
jgi:DNA/RNA endonuclease YhcR with UshA esterase domain